MKKLITLTILSSVMLLTSCQNNENISKPADIKVEKSKNISKKEKLENNSSETPNQVKTDFKITDEQKDLANKNITKDDYKKMSKKDKYNVLAARYYESKETRINSNNKYEASFAVYRKNPNGKTDIVIAEEIKNLDESKNKNIKLKLSKILSLASIDAKNYNDITNKTDYSDFKEKYTYPSENIYATSGFVYLSTLGYKIKPESVKVYDYSNNVYQWSAEWYNGKEYGGTSVGYFKDFAEEVRLINNNYSKQSELKYDQYKIKNQETNIVNSGKGD